MPFGSHCSPLSLMDAHWLKTSSLSQVLVHPMGVRGLAAAAKREKAIASRRILAKGAKGKNASQKVRLPLIIFLLRLRS